MGAIFSRIKWNWRQMTAFLIFMLVSSLATMLLPTGLASMIDSGVAENRQEIIFVVAAVMMILAVIGCAANVIAVGLSARISTKFAADIRQMLFHKVQDFSAADMDKFGTASLVTRSTSDVSQIQMFLNMLLRLGLMAPLMAVAGLVLSAATGGQISSVLTIAIPSLILGVGVIILVMARYSVALREKIDQLNRLFLEMLEGVRVIRAFNQQDRETQRFDEANAAHADLSIRSGGITALLMPVIQVVFGVTTAAVMALGTWYVSRGEMDVGALVANSQYISMILGAIILLSFVILMFPMAYACAKRIGEVLSANPSITDGKGAHPQENLRGTVVFDHVTFAYPGAPEPVLQDISFQCHPGQTVAIIGRTGCGKSSILKLIPRLYDPVAGHIYVDGVDVRRYRLAALRDLIGYVPQKNILFSGDIASNLNFGKGNGWAGDWVEAAHIACAKEFIEEKEGGYHAPVAQGGLNLSGGQRQRMAIARAVMKGAEIYLFDDSFSALDMKTDRQLRTNLKLHLGNATVIIVAQRISSILDADQILVLDQGRIVGKGTHQQLLKTCPLYREIAQLQLGEEALQLED